MRPWHAWRSRLNHDYLRNGLDLRLARYSAIVAGHVDADANDALVPPVEEFEMLFAEIDELIRAFPSQMSPRVLFEEPPLCHGQGEYQWLADRLHDNWMSQNAVRLIGDAQTALDETRRVHAQFRAIIVEVGPPPDAGHAEAVTMLRVCLHNLSNVLGAFPDRILPQ